MLPVVPRGTRVGREGTASEALEVERVTMALHCQECLIDVDPDGREYFYVYQAVTDDDVTLCSSDCLARYVQHLVEVEEEANEETTEGDE